MYRIVSLSVLLTLIIVLGLTFFRVLAPFGGAFTTLGLILCICSALMAFSAVAGRMTRSIDRQQMLRVVGGGIVASVLAMLLLDLGIVGLSAALVDGLDASAGGNTELSLLMRIGIAALALTPALLFPLIGALFGMSCGLTPGRGEGAIGHREQGLCARRAERRRPQVALLVGDRVGRMVRADHVDLAAERGSQQRRPVALVAERRGDLGQPRPVRQPLHMAWPQVRLDPPQQVRPGRGGAGLQIEP